MHPLECYSRRQQLITLISSISISLSAGTNYAFSIYSVQLAQRLHLSATFLNIVGIAGNLGMYAASPPAGRIIDRRGPAQPLLAAAVLISLGYALIWLVFSNPDLPLTVLLAILGNFTVGVGSSIANSSAIAGIASVLGPAHRATAMGAVLAGFGLSAFFWTHLASYIAKSDTAALLALFSVGPLITILLGTSGFFLVKISPNSPRPVPSGSVQDRPGSHYEGSEASYLLTSKHQPTEITGWSLAKEPDFWMIWFVMSLCAGIALMVINNIGTMIAALYHLNHHAKGTSSIRIYQAHAVSVISIFNCLGRVFAGSVSDGLKRHLSLSRVWWLTWISGLFLTSQLLSYFVVDELDQVAWLGGLVGFAYGNIYGTAPALILEWFGLQNFASNFGYLNISPLLSGQVFNLVFGKVFDHHSHRSANLDTRGPVCEDGKSCYQAALLITILGSLVSLVLSITLGFRRSQIMTSLDQRPASRSRTRFDSQTSLNGDRDEATIPILSSFTHHE